MSSRRKCAPPLRMDEEKKKQLCWNMHEDRRNEVIILDDNIDEDNPVPGPSTSSVSFVIDDDSIDEGLSYKENGGSKSVGFSTDEGEDSCSILTSISVQLNIVVSPYHSDNSWKALLGEFVLQLLLEKILIEKIHKRSFTLMRADSGDQLQICVHARNGEEGGDEEEESLGDYEEGILVESSLSSETLEDLRWLQKKKVIGLYQRPREDQALKVGIYLLEAGLSKSEFLSDGGGRVKKANQLIQKLMEKYYNFIIPENTLHFLWREVITPDGVKLYYNPFTGCIIREHPVAGPPWPGGILADEMGLGKTVEVLALILTHTRRDVKQDVLTLPEGKLVNFFVPPQPTEGNKKKKAKKVELKSKEKVQYPSLRVMILAAVKEMNVKKGASIVAIFKYVSAIYRYDIQRNRRLLKRTLEKLIAEQVVEQVKGHGLAGSFKLGKNYKEQKRHERTKKQTTRSPGRIQKTSLPNAKTQTKESASRVTSSEKVKPPRLVDIPAEEHDYCTTSKNNKKSETGQRTCIKEENLQPRVMDLESADLQGDLMFSDSTSPVLSACKNTDDVEVLKDQSSDSQECAGSVIQHASSIFPFNTSDYRFECICGELGLVDCKARVQCLKCHLWQHAECVNYKEENLKIKPFYCPHCLVAMKPVSTGATLIISPSSICHQWVDEINRHVRSSSLQVLVYQGVKKHGFLQPHMLAEQEVVITTYDVLRTELNYVDIPHSNSEDGRRFRNQKRYMAIPSPLVAVEWWRICLDEAQMVECTTAKAAEMALRLSGINRWCVSGTPVQRGLEDLYGLVLFLGVDPYWVKHWWDQLLYRPYCRKNPQPLYSLIANIMWRSAKKDVIDQHSGSLWWLDVIQTAIQYAIDEELVQRVQNEITSNYKQQTNKLSMADKFRDCRGLQYLLTTQMEEVKKFQKLVREAVKNLEGPPSKKVIEAATLCHLRPVRLPLNNCVFCKADELFTEYESKLFSHTVKGQMAIFEEMIEDEDGLVDDRLPTTSRGLWAASETERSLKAILSFAKAHRMDVRLIEEGNIFLELFEAWKKEYKLLHEYWMVLRDHVSAIDELAMATERLRVRHPDEPKPSPPVLHIIEPHEVEQNRVKLLNDKAVAKSQLQKKLGQLLYLTNLEKSQDKTTGGVNPEPCPICARQLGKQWAVLTCGHCFCNECIAIIIEQYSVGTRRSSIKCAICRQTTSHKEISYVFTAETANQEDDIPVKGSHSTKVEAVVRTLKKIQFKDPGAKSLVFSTWQDVLDIISKALDDNNMVFAQINGISKFQENLSAFKYDPKINILLLPLHTGSNGLNIIEATHVLLVEPILNPAHELQAIGRVHRIGQTK
ncbi:E3 ubiquitin-protein ligase SHPRH [Chelonia mydas]|uniref:E3 ubiquitin-protein ligase SHPRH n=1 Tax=Chelonia mydas TaxID=8469 RepID=M7BMH1_CHEMY|nr:E3 ubiquitin-protein ligase SHPRH [Chelonia mydas]